MENIRIAPLSQDEYNQFHSFTPIEDSELYRKLLAKAIDVVNDVTNHYYVFHDLESDPIEFRKRGYKKAIACQIEYFYETDATTTEGLNSAPQFQQIGRIMLSSTPKSSHEDVPHKPLVCPDAYRYLSRTGLLNRGIGS